MGSLIRPSAAHIWGPPDGCRAYPLMAQTYPERETSPEAAEGTAAHEPAAAWIEGIARSGPGFRLPESIIGTPASNGVTITEEMYEGAELWAQEIGRVMVSEGIFGGDNLFIERHVKAPRVHALSDGTMDAGIYSPVSRQLWGWDYKFGFRPRSAFECWQLINYVAGVMDTLGIDGYTEQGITVHLTIVQPRAYLRDGPVDTWTCRLTDLRGYINQLAQGAAESLSANPLMRSGSHCRDCPARFDCTAAHEAGTGLYEVARHITTQGSDTVAMGLQLSVIRRAIEQLEALETGLSEQIEATIRGGRSVPGWTVKPSKGRKVWEKPVGEVLKMGELLGVDLNKPGAITPRQAIAAGVPEAMVEAFSTQSSGLKLQPLDGQDTRRIFTNNLEG